MVYMASAPHQLGSCRVSDSHFQAPLHKRNLHVLLLRLHCLQAATKSAISARNNFTPHAILLEQ